VFVHVPSQIGYGALFGLILGESAGIPLPGETALIGAGLLAGAGHLSLPIVIGVAAGAAMLGDNVGYWVGRRGGRAALLAPRGPFRKHRRALALRGAEFFDRHGGKAVFLGRWISGVRVVAAPIAGASSMPWQTFLIWNALGAVAWAASVAGIAALLGPVAAGAIYGAGLAAVGVGAAVVFGRRTLRRRRERHSKAHAATASS
jgi:membrane-associated protein